MFRGERDPGRSPRAHAPPPRGRETRVRGGGWQVGRLGAPLTRCPPLALPPPRACHFSRLSGPLGTVPSPHAHGCCAGDHPAVVHTQ